MYLYALCWNVPLAALPDEIQRIRECLKLQMARGLAGA